jgi:hypothetical protein
MDRMVGGTSMTEHEKNQQLAEQIARSGGWNGQPRRPGEWVALLDGRVVAVADDLGAALRALRGLEPDPERGMVVEIGPSPVDVIR